MPSSYKHSRIAYVDIYGDTYKNDRLFDSSSCKIGENLLIPMILLKRSLEMDGHELHTIDYYDDYSQIDYILFQDLYCGYLPVCNSLRDYGLYLYGKKWKTDYLTKAIRKIPWDRRFLIMQEPPVVCPKSYEFRNQKLFYRVLTWDDGLVDNKKFYKFSYPQVFPTKTAYCPFEAKLFLTMICGNKKSSEENELYSERRKVIDYFESINDGFDLYGFGWENESLKNYCGTTGKKIETLSKYKYCICFENMKGKSGYITEKIFDCFFAGCVPIYWGADNINEYVPENCYIDWRKFSGINELVCFLKELDSEKYNAYLNHARSFIKSDRFRKEFSVESYIERVKNLLFSVC